MIIIYIYIHIYFNPDYKGKTSLRQPNKSTYYYGTGAISKVLDTSEERITFSKHIRNRK